MEHKIFVTKRNGETENYDAEKINKILKWATDGITGVNIGDVAMKMSLNLIEGITSSQIHDTVVESAADLISEKTPNYAKVAARLFSYKLRKEVWGGKNAPKLYDIIERNTEKGFYHPDILENYTKGEIDKIDEYINHTRDDFFDYGGLIQMSEKYLVQNRKSKTILETPQFMFALMGMTVFMTEGKKDRLKWIKKFYDKTSQFKVNWPTPILAGARTLTNSYSSCCLMDVADTKNSLFAANTAAGLVTCDRYGIGVNLSKIRPINAPIKNGDTLHSGVISWLKMYQDTIHACQQGGARRGAGTFTFNIFHPEIMTVLELKNNQGTHENRVPHLDYSIVISNIFYERLIKKESISLFGSHVAPDLYEKFGTPEFDELYLKYEASDADRVEVCSHELFTKLFTERLETGRIYVLNVDIANETSPWLDTVQMSNLCQEILQPLIPERITNDPVAEIGVCVLAATNMLKIKTDNEHKEVCELIVRGLNHVIDRQHYSVKACENFAKNKRSLGVGITNLAAWLASQGLNHDSKEAPQAISDFMEKQQYYLMQSSCDLAKEQGAAPDFHRSKYHKGRNSPLDLYKKTMDTVVEPHNLPIEMWDDLMSEIAEYGMRNMTLSAQMPVESSSVIQNTTNGEAPIGSNIVRKTSKGKTAIQVVPSLAKWKNIYLKKGDIKNNNGIIKTGASLVKWLDMASSFNLYYNSTLFEDGNIPLSVLVKDHLYATHLGMPTFYYCNSKKKADSLATADVESVEVIEETSGCVDGACSL